MNQEGKKWSSTLRYWLGGLLFIIMIPIAYCFVILIFALSAESLKALEMEMIALWVIGSLFSIWFITSPLICLYWLFKPAEWCWWKHKYISHAIGFGSFLGCVVIIAVGIHFLLWFFPDGKAGSQARFYIAGAIGIIATLALWDRLYQALEQRLQTDREARIHSDLRWKMRSLCAPLKLNQALTEFRRREKELDKLWEEDKLSPFQEEERIVFQRLWEKENLRQIIKVLTEARKEHRLNAFGKKLFTELVQKLEELEEVEEW